MRRRAEAGAASKASTGDVGIYAESESCGIGCIVRDSF